MLDAISSGRSQALVRLAVAGRGARAMSKLWRVDKALEDSEGLRWVREQLGAYSTFHSG